MFTSNWSSHKQGPQGVLGPHLLESFMSILVIFRLFSLHFSLRIIITWLTYLNADSAWRGKGLIVWSSLHTYGERQFLSQQVFHLNKQG